MELKSHSWKWYKCDFVLIFSPWAYLNLNNENIFCIIWMVKALRGAKHVRCQCRADNVIVTSISGKTHSVMFWYYFVMCMQIKKEIFLQVMLITCKHTTVLWQSMFKTKLEKYDAGVCNEAFFFCKRWWLTKYQTKQCVCNIVQDPEHKNQT